MKKIICTTLCLSLFLSGCAYNVTSSPAKALNIYTAHDNKIEGKYTFTLDDSIKTANRTIKTSSYTCSLHNYPVDISNATAVSVRSMLEAVFENATESKTIPTKQEMIAGGIDGAAVVRLDDFSPRLSCSQGFWSVSCSATTDITFSIQIRGQTETLISTSSSGSKSYDGDGGPYCGSAPSVLSESISKATKDALERIAERLANSNKLRAKR